jgi:hypothetical protein
MFGPYVNPLFGYGQPIGDIVDGVGLTIYFLVNGEFPALEWGAPPPIISTPDLYTPMPIPPPTPETGTPFLP